MTEDLFPLLYHTQYTQHSEDLQFWLDLSESQGSPILELGCGTGRVLLNLSNAGYQVYGLDRQASMLAVLQSECPAHLKPLIHLVQSDMTAFKLDKAFPLVICPCNTLSTLSSQQRLSALECIKLHLHTNGLFVAALPNPFALRSLPAHSHPEIEEFFAHPLSGHPVQVSTSWERKRRQLVVDWYYDHLFPDGRVDQLVIQIKHTLATTKTILSEFQLSGLRIIETYGDFKGSHYSKDSPHLILLARPT